MRRTLVFAILCLLSPAVARAADVALVGARVYAAPDAPPLDDAVVLLHGHDIAAVGKRGATKIPGDARVVDCKGKIIVAGFWNSHVHLTEPVFAAAAHPTAAALGEHVREMLTRWGVTTAFDLGSDPVSSTALRDRIARGELDGPRFLLAASVFPAGPNPVYLKSMTLPKAATPDEAAKLARGGMARAGDGLKLFTGVFMGDQPTHNMPVEVARAAVAVAHAAGKPVFAHPQNHAGVACALASGVDVLAHTIPTEGHFSAEELAQAKTQHTALVPTLALWRIVMRGASAAATDAMVKGGGDELAEWQRNGGTILFGTDVGYHDQYDTTQELSDMARVLSWQAILASLTTNPATFFHAADRGRVAPGLRADLVVLAADPALDARNLAKVAYTIRDGRIIYQHP